MFNFKCLVLCLNKFGQLYNKISLKNDPGMNVNFLNKIHTLPSFYIVFFLIDKSKFSVYFM